MTMHNLTPPPRLGDALAAIPDASQAARKFDEIDYTRTSRNGSVHAICPECGHDSVSYKVDPERWTMGGKCWCDHCDFTDWDGTTTDAGVFPLSRCRRPRSPVTYDTSNGDLAVHRVACGTRRSDPDGCGRYFEEQWASQIANTLRKGAWVGATADSIKEQGRLQKAAMRKGEDWFSIPQADGLRVYVSVVELPNLEMVWVPAEALFTKMRMLMRQVPHDDERQVSHPKRVTSWRERRRTDEKSSRRVVGFGRRSWHSLQTVADTFGLDGRSEALLVFSESDRDSDVGRGALDLMGVTLRVEAMAEAFKVSGEGVSTRTETLQGDGEGAHPAPADAWFVDAESDHDDPVPEQRTTSAVTQAATSRPAALTRLDSGRYSFERGKGLRTSVSSSI